MNFEKLIGKKVNEYTIKKKIGEGGFGVTFEAEDSLGGRVAIKFIKPKKDSDWKKEAEKAARVREIPQIASVYTVGDAKVNLDGKDETLHYIVWEFIDGSPLEELFNRSETISTTTIVDLTQEICKAIKGMQDAGLEHGDLHTNNILLVSPKSWDPIKKHTVKIVDFGLAKSVREKFTNDMDYLKVILNRCWQLNQNYGGFKLGADKKFHNLLTELLTRMCDSNPERKLKDPIEIINRIDTIQKESSDFTSLKSVNLSHPFEFLNVEEMPENSDLVHFLYTDNVPWLKEITDFGTTIISGPRGSGKSMILKNMRLLTKLHSDDFTSDHLSKQSYMGFYAHCQHNLYYPFAGISLNYDSQKCDLFVHYLNLIFTAEIIDSLILLEELDLHKLSSISKTKLSEFFQETVFQDDTNFISLNPDSLLSQCKSFIEKEILLAQKKILTNGQLEKKTTVGYLAKIIKILDNLSDAFRNSQIYFLLDDYSDPKIPFVLQKSINRIIGYRNNRFCFKITTEKFGFTPEDSDGKTLQLDREFSYIDLGSRYAKAKSLEKKKFILKILEKRLQRANVGVSVEQFFGQKPFKGKIADALLKEKLESEKNQEDESAKIRYAGFDMIYRLCMGDVSTILQLCKEIYMQAEAEKENLNEGVSTKLQDRIIKNFSKRRLNMIKELPNVGIDLYNLVESFGNISKKYLYEYSTIKDSKFYEVLRLELTESTGCLCSSADVLFKNLIREHIFVEGGGSPSWGKGAGNVKLILRPIYTPALKISYSDRYSIKTNCKQLEKFLTKPKDFEKSGTKFLQDVTTKQETITLDSFTVSLRPDAEEEVYE